MLDTEQRLGNLTSMTWDVDVMRGGVADVAGGGGAEGGDVGRYSMRGELLVGRHRRVSGMPFPFSADQHRIWNPFPKPQSVSTASRPCRRG